MLLTLLPLIIAMAAAAPNKQVDPLWAEPTYGEWVEVERIPAEPQPQAQAVEERKPLLATKWWDWVFVFTIETRSFPLETCSNLFHFRTWTQ